MRIKVTLQELQSLIGVLSFACSVVELGMTFLRRLIDLTIGLKRPHHKRRLNNEARADLKAWSLFINSFNGSSIFLSDIWNSSVSLDLHTDASNIGYGGFLGNKWFAEEWPKQFTKFPITVKELFPIVLAIELWGEVFKNQCILFHTDNLAVVHIVNKQTSKDKTLMKLTRRLIVQCLRHNIMFRAKHIAGSKNQLADELSRMQIKNFLSHFHFQDPQQVRIPTEMLNL